MRWLFALALVGFLGCGRVDFGTRSDAATADAIAHRHCNDPAMPPPTLTVAGTVFYYTSFTTTSPLAGITAQVVDGEPTPPSATSDANGMYSLSVATHGAPVPTTLVYSSPSEYTTTIWLDAPLARDLTGGAAPTYAWPGDAPMWNSGAMTTVYNAAGVTQAATAGSINIRPTDCAGNLIAGVSVAISPPPGALDYIDSSGRPNAALTATTDPFRLAFAANAVAGPTHITLSGAGLSWPAVDIDVVGGANNTLVVVRGEP